MKTEEEVRDLINKLESISSEMVREVENGEIEIDMNMAIMQQQIVALKWVVEDNED